MSLTLLSHLRQGRIKPTVQLNTFTLNFRRNGVSFTFLDLRADRLYLRQRLHLLIFYLLKYFMHVVLIGPASIFIPHTKLFAHEGAHSTLAMRSFPGGRPAPILLISLSLYAPAQMPNTLFKQVCSRCM